MWELPQPMPPSDAYFKALARIQAAERPVRAWVTGSQLPWNDPEFSRRMLDVHLDPSTNMASRSGDVISIACPCCISGNDPIVKGGVRAEPGSGSNG